MKTNEILQAFEAKVKNINDIQTWDEVRVEFLGKKGAIQELMNELKNAENKKELGQEINEVKVAINKKLAEIRQELEKGLRDQKLKAGAIDVTIPSKLNPNGKQNILLQTKKEIENIFMSMGFEVALGQEVEDDYHNFEALNLGEDHPARDMQDTFYINPEVLLRTHTSNIQSRTLETNVNKELKIICPGKVYRRDDDDATHSHQFMQIEGLVVVHKDSDYTASLKDLKTTLTIFAQKIFNDDKLLVRLRPSYFPFTEPSVEVDVTCSHCYGEGCSFCKKSGWIEILGAGVVNPKVLEINGYDSEQFSGFAFGLGVERITLLKYSIDDIRTIYQNSNDFINQY